MVASGFEVVGREDELARLRRFVQEVVEGPGGTVIRGDAGVGKTVLWRAGLEMAERAGARVLVTRCAEAEMPLAFGGLGDLLDPAFADVADELADPQRTTVAVALGLEAPLDEAPDRLALPRAFLACLRALADRVPVLLGIDDVQWLDAPSQRILAFAAKRLGNSPVGILATQRGDAGDPIDLRHAFEERFHEIHLGPLSVGALHHLIRTRLGARFPRPLSARVHEASGGNPMFALEFAQAAVSGREPLALPSSLEELVRERVAGFPPAVLPLLAAVAAVERPTRSLLEAVVDDADASLDTASTAGAVTVDSSGFIRFTHPLLASAAYAAVPPGVRRALHARLAAVGRNVEERARHVALSTPGPDGDAAGLLEEAAARAWSRGAPHAAAELGREAVRLTPSSERDDRDERLLTVAELVLESGDLAGAAAVLDKLLASGVSGPRRAEALLLRYRVEDDAECAGRFVEEALAHVDADAALHVRVLLRLSAHAAYLDDPTTSLMLARQAVVEAEKLGEQALVAEALAQAARMSAAAGRREPALAERAAAALKHEHGSQRGVVPPRITLGDERVLAGDLVGARQLLEAELAAIVRSGREGLHWQILAALVSLELQAGNWELAERHFEAASELVFDSGTRWAEMITRSQAGLIAALRGRVEDARRLSTEAATLCESFHLPSLVALNRAVLGCLELSLGTPDSAWELLSRPPAAVERRLPTYPGFPEAMPDAVEALVELGRLDEAKDVLARFEARSSDHAWAAPARLRCRALILLAHREGEPALALAEEAALAAEAIGFPLDRGRALLTAGEALRRLGQRRRAAQKLQAAKDIFVELGAPLWQARAETELHRASPRPRRDRELTSAERRVAALVASGRTNREVAAQLFTTVGTVEVHLTRIYRKLDVRSRTELARLVADGSLDLAAE